MLNIAMLPDMALGVVRAVTGLNECPEHLQHLRCHGFRRGPPHQPDSVPLQLALVSTRSSAIAS